MYFAVSYMFIGRYKILVRGRILISAAGAL